MALDKTPEPLKHSIAERAMAKDTLALIQEIALQ